MTGRWRFAQNFPGLPLLDDRFPAANFDPALAQPGHDPPFGTQVELLFERPLHPGCSIRSSPCPFREVGQRSPQRDEPPNYWQRANCNADCELHASQYVPCSMGSCGSPGCRTFGTALYWALREGKVVYG